MGKLGTLRSVRGSVKRKAKGTFGRIIRRLRSDEDNAPSPQSPRSSLPSLWCPTELPSVPGPLEFFKQQIVHIDSTDSTITEDSDPPNKDTHLFRPSNNEKDSGIKTRTPVTISEKFNEQFAELCSLVHRRLKEDRTDLFGPSNNETDSAIEKRTSATVSRDLNDQFAELCSLVHRQLKQDTTPRKQRAHTSSYDDETDDDIDPALREYLQVPIKSFRSAQSLRKVETSLRSRRPTGKETSYPPPIIQQNSTIVIRHFHPGHFFKTKERSDDGSSAKATCGTKTPAESPKYCETLESDTQEDSSPSPNEPLTIPDGDLDCVLVGIDPEEHIEPKCIDLEPTLQRDLEEGFRSFLTLPFSGPGSPVRAHGTDFYEYPSVPMTPPPHFKKDRDESLDATCALYDNSYSDRSSQTTGIAAGTHESVGLSRELERQFELARVAEEMHHWALTPPQWTTFPVKTGTPVIATEPRVETDRSKELRDSEATIVTHETDNLEPMDVVYGNGIDRVKGGWRWEASSGRLLCLREQPTVTVEEVTLKSNE